MLQVALLLRQLALAHTWRHVDILAGDTRAADFLAKNPNGKIPLLEGGDGFRLAELATFAGNSCGGRRSV